MSKAFPNPNQSNPPMTRGQRRAWLALEEQKRRRARAAAPPAEPVMAIVLSSDGHGRLTWALNFDSPKAFNIYRSADGVNWGSILDSADSGARAADESGTVGYLRICQCDGNGYDVLPYSNMVHSDGL